VEKIGLIAGNRKFPILFAQAAKQKGCRVIAVAIKKDTSPLLSRIADKVHWISLGDFSRMFDLFQKEGVTEVVMAGQISPHRLFSKEVSNNPEIQKILGDMDKYTAAAELVKKKSGGSTYMVASPGDFMNLFYANRAQPWVVDNTLTVDPMVDKMVDTAKTFRDKNGDIREVMKTMLTSDEFFSQTAYRAKVKSPLEMIVSAVRATGAQVDFAFPLANQIAQLGQPLHELVCRPADRQAKRAVPVELPLYFGIRARTHRREL